MFRTDVGCAGGAWGGKGRAAGLLRTFLALHEYDACARPVPWGCARRTVPAGARLGQSMAHIRFLAKKRAESVYQLTSDVVMGRSLDCDIFIPDIFVSRKHCRIEQTTQGWRITDTQSRNGV